jgi:phosphate transport system protein
MPREQYQERLDRLRADVVAMGELVGERYETAIEAAAAGDDALAREVIEGDHEVNETYLGLEDDCTELLALQQPVAGDLRLVAASFKVITDLERVADLATNLAGYGGPDGGVHPAVEFRELGAEAGEMVADAVAAYGATPRRAGRSPPATTRSTIGAARRARRSSGSCWRPTAPETRRPRRTGATPPPRPRTPRRSRPPLTRCRARCSRCATSNEWPTTRSTSPRAPCT